MFSDSSKSRMGRQPKSVQAFNSHPDKNTTIANAPALLTSIFVIFLLIINFLKIFVFNNSNLISCHVKSALQIVDLSRNKMFD